MGGESKVYLVSLRVRFTLDYKDKTVNGRQILKVTFDNRF